jgi:hypothetical protein
MELVTLDSVPIHIQKDIRNKIRNKVIKEHINMGFVKVGGMPIPRQEKVVKRDIESALEDIMIFKTGHPSYYFFTDQMQKIGF